MQTGIDIVSIERMRKAASPRFIERVFTETEARQCLSHKDPARCFALLFAAKEACLKALSTGLAHGIRWRDLEVELAPRPAIRLRSVAGELLRGRRVFLSAARSRGHAFALVAIE